MNKKLIEMGVAGIAGMQIPLGIKRRKKKVDELLECSADIDPMQVIAFLTNLNDDSILKVEKWLDEGNYEKLSNEIKATFNENMIKSLVKGKVAEVVRKNDSGGYSLYAPNPGKNQPSKKVADFPTKLAAKRAELQRFPPKDTAKVEKKRKELEKLQKHPELAAVKNTQFLKKKKKAKKESFEVLKNKIVESIFREEKEPSQWNDYLNKLSKEAVLSDKNFQKHQSKIKEKSKATFKTSLKKLASALSSDGFAIKDHKVVDSDNISDLHAIFYISSEMSQNIGPFKLIVKNGYPKITAGEKGSNSFVGLESDKVKKLKSELSDFQENVLDNDDSIKKLIEKRDQYLSSAENKLDKFVSNLTSLEISMLKNLLVKKYRKL